MLSDTEMTPVTDVNRKYKRITKHQQEVLLDAFRINIEWSNDFIKQLQNQLGLSYGKIYKWNWEQRKKYDSHGKI